jgi:RND family efflux transporter MFP subunit
MTRKTTLTVWVALAVVAAAGVAAYLFLKPPPVTAVGVPLTAPLELARSDVHVLRVQELTRTLVISGGLKAANTAVVKARVAAELQTLSVREGDTVRAGQVIGQLNVAEYGLRLQQAEQTAAAARAQLDIAQRTLATNRALLTQGFISATGLETSLSNAAAAQANWQAAVAGAELARKTRSDSALVAPISGVVSERFAQPGERLGLDARVVEVVDLSRMELEAAVAPEDMLGVQLGQRAQLQIDGLSGAAAATVVRINPSTQIGTRSVLVYLALQPHLGLRQGLFARGHIELQRKTTLVAPELAVRTDQASPYVLAIEGSQVVQRPVTLGLRGEAVFENQTAPAAAVELLAGGAVGERLLLNTVGSVRTGTSVQLPAEPAPPR